MRGLVDRGRRVAAAERIVVLNARAADERIRDRDRGSLGFDVDPGEPRRAARLIARARDDREQSLTVEQDLIEGEQRLIGENRRNVVLARNIRRRQDRDDARGRAHRLQAEALQLAGGLAGHADRDMQRARGLADVVDVGRCALNVQARGIMRQRLVNDRGRGRFEDGQVIIRRHAAFQSGSARQRRRFPSAPSPGDWRRPSSDRRPSRACR